MANREAAEWDEIVERYARRVFRVAMRILGSIQDAEDVSQDVFSEVFRLYPADPEAYGEGMFVRLATLRSIDRLRRQRPCQELREGDHSSRVEPIDEMAAAELAQSLRSVLPHLPDQQSTVFVMICLEQQTRDEVAATLGVSVEAVSTALYKARRRLSQLLDSVHRGVSK